jgi:hypothetical protein
MWKWIALLGGLAVVVIGMILGSVPVSVDYTSCGSAFSADPGLWGMSYRVQDLCDSHRMVRAVFAWVLIGVGAATGAAGAIVLIVRDFQRVSKVVSPRFVSGG